MSQVKWIKGPICGIDNCRSRLYMRSAGRKFCQFGHVAEGNLDIEDEEGEAYSQTKRLNIQFTDTGFGSQTSVTSTPNTTILKGKGSQRYYGEKGHAYQYKCFQHILREITPKIVHYLYRDFGNDAVKSLVLSVDPIAKLFWVRCVKKTFTGTRPTVVDLFTLVYLALRQLNRYPIFVDEYLEMMTKNKVPFFNAVDILTFDMRVVLPVNSSKLFNAQSAPLEDRFYVLVAKWSVILGVNSACVTPLDYSYPIVCKLLVDLRLPHVPQILVAYHELAHEFTKGHFVHKSISSVITVPEIQIVGLAYYAIRLYLLASSEVVDTEKWMKWLSKKDELLFFKNRFHSASSEDLMKLSEPQVNKYLDWMYETLIPNEYNEPDSEHLTLMQKKLDKIFTYAKTGTVEVDFAIGAPLGIVENTISAAEIPYIDGVLESFICEKYGLRQSTLELMRERIDRDLHEKISYDIWR